MIQKNETFKEFGYYPESLKKRSRKSIICECDYCYKLYKITQDRRFVAHKKLNKDACKKCGYKKQQEISLKEHGCKNPLQRKEVKEKLKQTNLNKYGVEYYTQTKEFKEKTKQTNLDKYGVEYNLQRKEIKDKIKKTNLEKYGVECVFKSEEIKNKINKTRTKNGFTKKYNNKTMKEWSKKLEKPYSTFVLHVREQGFEKAIKIPACCSGLEYKLKSWLDEEGIKYEQHVKIEDKYCDFLIDNLILELDGLYWHCDKVNKDNNYHINKKNLYNKLEYKSLFFRENEINDQFEIVKSIIKNQLGLGKRIFARKCKFKQLDKQTAKQFFIDNHLMGRGIGIPYALIYNDKIISILQVKRVKNKEYEISRFCSLLNTNIIGGFSKLLKNMEKTLDMDNLKTFVDCRYGVGDYLKNFGFEKKTCHKSFKWVNGTDVVNRMKFPGNSGYENGFAKIWDCGQIKYMKYYNINK